MISDEGNEIKSTKYKVWVMPDGSGIVEIAYHKNHRPPGTSRDYWIEGFQKDGMLKAMRTLYKRKKFVEAKEGHKLQVYCKGCNTMHLMKPFGPYEVDSCQECNGMLSEIAELLYPGEEEIY